MRTWRSARSERPEAVLRSALGERRRGATARQAQPGGARAHPRALERSRGDRVEGDAGAARRAAAPGSAWARPAARARARRRRARRAPAARASRRRARSRRRAARRRPACARARRPHGAGADRPQAAEAGRGAGEPGDERAPARRRRARARAARAAAYQPWPAASRQLSRARAAHHGGARLVREDREQREQHEGAEGQRDATHQFTFCIGRCGADQRGQLDVRPPLAREPGQRALERVAQRAPDEERVGERRERVALLELVLELQRHLDLVGLGRERDPLACRAASRPRPPASAPRAPRRRVTRSTTRPRPPGFESHTARAPTAGQSPSSLTTWPKPSTHDGQRCGSYQTASASEARPGTRLDGADAWHRAPVSLPSRRCSPSGR